MSDFRKLKVWRKAFALAITTHNLSQGARGASYLSLDRQRGMGAIPQANCDSAIRQTIEVKKMLHGLINSLGSES